MNVEEIREEIATIMVVDIPDIKWVKEIEPPEVAFHLPLGWQEQEDEWAEKVGKLLQELRDKFHHDSNADWTVEMQVEDEEEKEPEKKGPNRTWRIGKQAQESTTLKFEQARLDLLDIHQNTIFHLAAKAGADDAVMLLLKNVQLDRRGQNTEGLTAADCA